MVWKSPPGALLAGIALLGLGPEQAGALETAAGARRPAFVFPEVKDDPNPVIIQGPAGEIFRFTRTGASTCGRYLLARTVVPAGAGPLPHIHHWTDEYFFFPNGGFTLYMGASLYPSVNIVPGRSAPKDHVHLVRANPGDLFYSPRYHVHGLINHTDKPQEMIFIWMPDTPEVSILNYFKSVGQVLTDAKNPPPIDPISKIRFVTEAPRYGINQSSDFFQYVETVDVVAPPMDDHREALLEMLTSVGDGTNCPR